MGALDGRDRGARRASRPEDVLRFDGNTPPEPPPTARPETIAAALERIQSYRHGGFPELLRAIADYNGVEPENVVLGAGADDLLMLCARAYAGPGDRIAIADEPSYPLYRVAAWVTGADVGDDEPVLTFVCRPHNPTARWSTSRRRGRSSSTRRTSSTAARPRCRSSATT